MSRRFCEYCTWAMERIYGNVEHTLCSCRCCHSGVGCEAAIGRGREGGGVSKGEKKKERRGCTA